MWLVVGYSGNNDPVFDHLAKTSRFDNNLYWVGHDNEPPLHVKDRLLRPNKDAYFLRDYDADDFFVRLSQELRIFPPDFAARPFSHLDSLLATVAPYKIPGEDADVDITAEARRLIQKAIHQYEQAPEDETATVLKASRDLLSGNYDGVIAQLSNASEISPELQSVLGWAYLLSGNALSEQAKTKSGSEADRLFGLARGKYEAALKIKPDKHEALYNWGTALLDQAKTKSGSEADDLFRLAGEKYEAALKMKPDKHEALYNWGTALLDQAKTKSGSEADDLFRLAGEKYEAALKIKPDKHEALNNWGNALLDQAKTKSGSEADDLFRLAGEKYEAALKIKPDKHEALNNWGNALLEQARTKRGSEADRLFGLAEQRLLSAEATHQGSAAYNLACVKALRGISAKCRQWLETAYRLDALPGYEHLIKDKDLDSVRDQAWFKQLLKKRKAA